MVLALPRLRLAKSPSEQLFFLPSCLSLLYRSPFLRTLPIEFFPAPFPSSPTFPRLTFPFHSRFALNHPKRLLFSSRFFPSTSTDLALPLFLPSPCCRPFLRLAYFRPVLSRSTPPHSSTYIRLALTYHTSQHLFLHR